MGERDIRYKFADFAVYPSRLCFFISTMVANINNFGVINFYENNASKQEQKQKEDPICEDISPVQEKTPEPIDSIIFTKKAKKEGKETFILQALRKSVQGRKDKTRAFVQELQEWQKEGYIDAHYNSRVMYDELDKLLPLPFGKEVFKKYYNNTI
jgi:hypothetical protein